MLKYLEAIVLNLQLIGFQMVSPLSVICSVRVFLILLGTHDDDASPLSIEHTVAADGFHCRGISNTKQTKCVVHQQIDTIRG